jgi:flavin reductase (DIM6/NTAB) family NADH-FMN oxidoreductase RutF
MALIAIPYEELNYKAFSIWKGQGILITSGDFEKGQYNTMTIGWGSLGVIWSTPFAMVAVRPTRHTYKFMEEYDSFTLCAFSTKYRSALDLLGTKSGRDGDKIRESGLTAIASQFVASPAFAEAELILECKKNYWTDLDPSHFLDGRIKNNYPLKDYHRIYFGLVKGVFGLESFSSKK